MAIPVYHEGPLGGGHTHHVSHGYHATDYVAPHPHTPFHLPDHHGHQVHHLPKPKIPPQFTTTTTLPKQISSTHLLENLS